MPIRISGTTADGVTVWRDLTELEINIIGSRSPAFARILSQLVNSIKEYESTQRKAEGEE